MFYAFSDAAWRVVVLLALALAPYAAPVDVVASTNAVTAIIRLCAFALVAIAVASIVRGAVATSKPLAAAAAATLVVAAIASFAFDGDRGPLARGVWFVAPFVWATIAIAAAGPIAQRIAAGKSVAPSLRNGAVLVVVGAAVASFAMATGRLGTRDNLWKLAVAIDPGNVSAALAVATSQRKAGDPRLAYETELACARARPEACRCDEAANSDAVDLGKYENARTALEAANTCPRTPRRVGLMAEALIGTNATDEGIHQAEIALASDPNEPHAAYARAWGTSLKGYPADAKKFAEQAVSLQRGLPANLLLGLIEYQLKDLDASASQFQAALQLDPNCVQANYDLALIAQQRNKYHDAREGYLRTLRLDPTYADAHYNLIVLTFNAGATGEAQHRLDEMIQQCPTDRRVSDLRAMLARGAQSPQAQAQVQQVPPSPPPPMPPLLSKRP